VVRPGRSLAIATALAAVQAPASAAVTVRDLVELTDIDSVSVSPDGRFAVFRTVRGDVGRNTYFLRWHSADLATGEVRDIGSGGDPIYSDPGLLLPEKVLWAANGRTIIVRELVDGAVGLWRGDVGGHAMNPLAVGDADVVDYAISRDGRSVTYQVGATRDQIRRADQQEYDRGILIDSSVDLSQNLFRGGSINGRMASQRLVGYWVVRDGLLWRAPRQDHSVDLETGSDIAIGQPHPAPGFDLAKYIDPDPPRAEQGKVEVTPERAKRGIAVSLSDGRKITCADPICASTALSWWRWRPGSNELILAFKDRLFRQSLYRWDLDRNRLSLILTAEGLMSGSVNDFRPCAISIRAAVCVSAGAGSPPRLERIDLETGERRVLLDPNAQFRSAYHPEVRYLEWPIGDGEEAAGVVLSTPAPGSSPAPLYVNYNRCEGFLRGGQGNEWPIAPLLEAGFAVACINAVPIDGPQNALKNYQLGLAAVRSLVERLSSEGLVDRSKVAMGGLSFGSEVAFWVAIHSRLLAALSVSSSQFEPADYWRRAMPGSDMPATMLKVWGLGDPDKTARRWREMSPALNADKIDIPVLFQMPEQEARDGPELYAKLTEHGTPTEAYAYPDEDHIKIQPRHRLAVYGRNLDWFRYWLQDYRDPDVLKADQYRRWDALRSRGVSARAKRRIAATTPLPPSHSSEAGPRRLSTRPR
jgi:dipeptidyl aminopeptidase/acylaminoacyl peptidase